jgi:hypothetical protein
MAKGRKKQKKGRITLPTKTYWHLYSLQALQPDKLIRTVNKVLNREYMLIK